MSKITESVEVSGESVTPRELLKPEHDKDFWDNLTKREDNILKFNSSGKYDRTFSNQEKAFLDYLHDLPEIPNIRVGNVINGKIAKIGKRELVIDFNYKDSIYVDVNSSDLKIIKGLNVDDDIKVLITSINDAPYEIKGSITELIKMDVSNKLRSFYKENLPFDATVKKIIPAGFMLNIEMDNINVDAFMPNTLAGVNKLTKYQIDDLLGETIEVMLESLQQEKGVYVVSRKKYLKTLIPSEIKKLKKEHIYNGTVTGAKDFGVFVEFNKCLTGMIHKVNLNPKFQDTIAKIPPGTEIEFYVKDVLKGNKIILSQNLNKSLWDTIKLGQVKTAKVKSVKPFGLLVELDGETTGLVQKHHLEKMNKKFEVGDSVKVKVISVIKDDRKIYLSFAK